MIKENIIELVNHFNMVSYQDLVGALIVYEKDLDLEDLTDEDMEKLENIYYKWLDSDISGLLDTDLKDMINKELGE